MKNRLCEATHTTIQAAREEMDQCIRKETAMFPDQVEVINEINSLLLSLQTNLAEFVNMGYTEKFKNEYFCFLHQVRETLKPALRLARDYHLPKSIVSHLENISDEAWTVSANINTWIKVAKTKRS